MNAAREWTFEEISNEQRTKQLVKLRSLVIAFEKAEKAGTLVQTSMGGEWRWLQWEGVQAAYRALRSMYIKHRVAPKRKLESDPTLERWAEERSDFFDAFWGPERADGKRYFDGVDVGVRDTVERYQAIQRRWHKKMPEYRAQRRKAAKRLGTNKTEKAKAQKEAWKLSASGQAWWEAQKAKRRAATAKRKADKLAAKAGTQ